jgi:YfiH family protein
VTGNRNRLAQAVGRDPRGVVMGLQVHGAGVQVHDRALAPPDRREANPRAGLEPSDVQVTASALLTPLVLAADCFPLALCAPGAAAMAHCGWRGIAAGAVRKAVKSVCRVSGSRPGDVHAALGPGIRACCYAVGPEVAAAFHTLGHDDAVGEEGRLDLARAIRAELELCGVEAASFVDCEVCTSCDPERFFSHRRDGGVTGRQAGLAWLDS